MNVTLPQDSGETIEVCPGVFIPMSRYDEFSAFIETNPNVAEAVAEIILEKTSADPLTDDECLYVPFALLADVQRRLAERLILLSIDNARQARRVRHSMAASALAFGEH